MLHKESSSRKCPVSLAAVKVNSNRCHSHPAAFLFALYLKPMRWVVVVVVRRGDVFLLRGWWQSEGIMQMGSVAKLTGIRK